MTNLITVAGIEESISIAFSDAAVGNVEHANIRAQLAQAQATLLLVDRLDKLLAQLKRWDCDDQLAVISSLGRNRLCVEPGKKQLKGRN